MVSDVNLHHYTEGPNSCALAVARIALPALLERCTAVLKGYAAAEACAAEEGRGTER